MRRLWIGAAAAVLAGALLWPWGTALPSTPEVLTVYGGLGTEPGRLNRPRAVTEAGGVVYVLDLTDRVQAFDLATGSFLRLWHLPDIRQGRPQRILAEPGGTLLVADTHYGRVLRYDAQGTLLSQWGSIGKGPGSLYYPVGLLCLPGGRIAVSEYGGEDRIQVFTPEGRFLEAWGGPGPEPGRFQRPQDLTAGPDGTVYVADAANQRVQAFSPEGRFLRTIGDGALSYPYDVAVDAEGRLLVLEYGAHRVSFWTPEGRRLGATGGPGCLASPWALRIAGDGTLLVTNSDHHRVERWKLPR